MYTKQQPFAAQDENTLLGACHVSLAWVAVWVAPSQLLYAFLIIVHTTNDVFMQASECFSILERELTNQVFRGHKAAHDARGCTLGRSQTNDLLRQVLRDSSNLQDVKLLGVEEVCGCHARLTSKYIDTCVLQLTNPWSITV